MNDQNNLDEEKLRRIFALRMSRALEHYGLSLTALANKLDCTPGFVHHLVSGKRLPSYDMFKRILNVFNHTSADYFFAKVDAVEANKTYNLI